jgi:hypothetical protein
MRARSYHASPGEVMSVGGCAQGLWMNAAMAARCQGTPGGGITGPPPLTSTNADGPGGCEKIRKGFRPDSYPHVTCEYTVTEQRDPVSVQHASQVLPQTEARSTGT